MTLMDSMSALAVRHLSPARLARVRGYYLGLRGRLRPLLRTIYGTFDSADLRNHLGKRLGMDFEILMVHSSFNHMQPMYTDSALDLMKMLSAFCGEQRTLVMPAFYFGDPRLGGAAATFRQNPRFDIRRTPSQMGLVTELFRRSSGVVQSRHPVYRVAARGPLAAALTSGHEHAPSQAGPGSPFDFMARHNTLIIGIGKRYDVVTQVHHAEEMLVDRFPVPGTWGTPQEMVLIDGAEEIPFKLRGRALKGQRNMWKLREIMDRQQLREWRYHHVPMFAVRAADVTDSLTAAAGRGITLYEQY
jgi:aminoglycoside 3-N-acetyltransferase